MRRFYRPRRAKPGTSFDRSAAWKIINSSIAIWTLTALFGGLGAFVFSNFQTCLKDADEKITRYQHLSDELYFRQEMIVQAVGSSLTLSELQSKLKNIRSTRDELKSQSLASIITERDEIHSQMVGVVQDDADVLSFLRNTEIPNRKQTAYYWLLDVGELDPDLDEGDLTKLHEGLLQSIVTERRKTSTRSSLSPYCTLPSAFRSLWGLRGANLAQR